MALFSSLRYAKRPSGGLCVATASAALRPQRRSHWLRAAPCIRLSHPTHLTRKVRQAAWLNDAAQSGYFDAGLSIEFSEWLIAVNGAMQLFQIAGVARQALGRPLGEELGNFLAGEQLAEQRPMTVVEAGVFKQISQGANDGGKRA